MRVCATVAGALAITMILSTGVQADSTAPADHYTVVPLNRVMQAVQGANARTGPGPQHPVLVALNAGVNVRVTGEVQGRDWLQVDLWQNGGAAFIYAPLLRDASEPPERAGDEWSVAENQSCKVWNFGNKRNEPFTWSGVCEDGKAAGEGRFTIRGGRYVYEGAMLAGKAHGYGAFTWADGERYEGEWHDGRPHGHGAYTLFDGKVYQGEWRDGCFGERSGRWASIATSAAACGFD